MATRVEREFDFQACVHFQNHFLINEYVFTLSLEVHTDSIFEQNVAMERLKFLFYETFENSIFVYSKETEAIQKYANAGLRVCVLPEEPYDQMIAMLLLLKSSAICEGKLKPTDIALTSKLSDQVKFIEQIEIATAAVKEEGWWSNNSPDFICEPNNKKDKVVKLVKDLWTDLGLGWKEKKSKSAEVLFTKKT